MEEDIPRIFQINRPMVVKYLKLLLPAHRLVVKETVQAAKEKLRADYQARLKEMESPDWSPQSSPRFAGPKNPIAELLSLKLGVSAMGTDEIGVSLRRDESKGIEAYITFFETQTGDTVPVPDDVYGNVLKYLGMPECQTIMREAGEFDDPKAIDLYLRGREKEAQIAQDQSKLGMTEQAEPGNSDNDSDDEEYVTGDDLNLEE